MQSKYTLCIYLEAYRVQDYEITLIFTMPWGQVAKSNGLYSIYNVLYRLPLVYTISMV